MQFSVTRCGIPREGNGRFSGQQGETACSFGGGIGKTVFIMLLRIIKMVNRYFLYGGTGI